MNRSRRSCTVVVFALTTIASLASGFSLTTTTTSTSTRQQQSRIIRSSSSSSSVVWQRRSHYTQQPASYEERLYNHTLTHSHDSSHRADDSPSSHINNDSNSNSNDLSTTRKSNNNNRIISKFKRWFKVDKKQLASLGVNFVLSYSIVSTINGAASLSFAWYFASIKTGLSPLVPGQWKSLLAAYGALYAIITLMRPLRVAIAIALSRRTGLLLDRLQSSLGCSHGTAILVQYSLGWAAWAGLAFLGIHVAAACSGVPILPNP